MLDLNCEVEEILLVHRSNSFHNFNVGGKNEVSKEHGLVNGTSKLALFLKS